MKQRTQNRETILRFVNVFGHSMGCDKLMGKIHFNFRDNRELEYESYKRFRFKLFDVWLKILLIINSQ